MSSIPDTRLAKELEILSKSKSDSINTSFDASTRILLVNFKIKSSPITYEISLPQNYPFSPPSISSVNTGKLSSYYKLSQNLIEIVLKKPWTPVVNLKSLVEQLYSFSVLSLTDSQPHSIGKIGTLGVFLIAITVRCAMFSQGFSGFMDPPLYGDYEAQRHWMELTVNFPVNMWYKDTPATDPKYWRLDYPPLTALHSYICGLISLKIEPESVALYTSRGYFTQTHLLFMRMTVLFSEMLIYLPAIYLFFKYFHWDIEKSIRTPAILLLILSPPLLLIDHGHFQYNNVMLGLALFSVILTMKGKYATAAVFLALCFNFKIMGLYYCLPLVTVWVAQCFQNAKGRGLRKGLEGIGRVAWVGCCGLAVCVVLWMPWMNYEGVLEILARIFPLHRGVFEDKVATFWCITSMVVKYRLIFSTSSMALITLVTTLVASSPFVYYGITKRNLNASLLYSISGVSLSFFLFSYHVHEKTILLPMLPIALLWVFKRPELFELFSITATFSLYPLLILDGLRLPYFAFQILYLSLSRVHMTNLSGFFNIKPFKVWYLLMVVLHLCESIKPPEKYPYLFNLSIAFYSFVCFAYTWVELLRGLRDLNDEDISSKIS